MKINKRQTALLFELISARSPLSYDYLQNYFEVSKRTLREDIKCLNDLLSEDYLIQIQYQSQRGFYLVVDNEEDLETLKNRMNSRFSDSWEIENSMIEYYYQIIAYFFSKANYGRMDELSSLLNLNSRTVSNLLKETKERLKKYQLYIEIKPHYGMKIQGREVHIRYCTMDIIYRYSSELKNSGAEENLVLFQLNKEEKETVYSLCLNYVHEVGLNLSPTTLQKWTYLILISKYRLSLNHRVDIKDEEKQLYRKFSNDLKIHGLIQKLEDALSYTIDEEEVCFYGIYLLTHLENDFQHNCIKEMSEPLLNGLLEHCEKYGILKEGKSKNKWKKGLRHVVGQIVLADAFDVFERSPNATMKKAGKNSPLSTAIASICCDYLEEKLNKPLSETGFVNLILAVYSCIRDTQNIKRLNSIAVLTPLDKSYGESLKRRVLDRYSNIIKNIEVISAMDLNDDKLKDFNTLLYCGDIEPLNLRKDLFNLKVDYFFTEEDVRVFYEKIVVPSRIYKKAFGKLYYEDYKTEYWFSSMKSLIQDEIAPHCSADVLKQLDHFIVDEYSVFNRTLNIILFVNEAEECFSKLLYLRNTGNINHTKFIRVFIHAIKLDGDFIKLKTSEKVIRNVTCFKDIENGIANDKYLDFYDHYILGVETTLKKRDKWE